MLGRLGDAKVDHLRHGSAVVQGDHHVGGLDVAVDDPLLVSVLDRTADIDKQLQTLVVVRLFLSQYSVIGMPRTSSMTK